MIVLIPAYEPDERLVALVRQIRSAATELNVLVVDDGSGAAYRMLFDEAARAGAVVIRHEVNRGKGRALKTGFAYAASLWPGEPLVCADSDGQHTVPDILAVAERVQGHDRVMVLGARQFTGTVPLRSRAGNGITRRLFFLTTGMDLTDTQTGLRGYPPDLIEWLIEVPGERFEYELELLLRARQAQIPVVEVPIATVYLDGNASSHFRPVQDSARVYAPLLRFGASSAFAAGVDYAALFGLHALTGSLLASVVGARATSAGVNYLTNRQFVFGRGERRSGRRYAALVLAILAANWALMHLLVVGLGASLLLAKLVTEGTLFFVSYAVQSRLVFAHRLRPAPMAAPVRSRAG